MSRMSNRVARLERAAQPRADWEVCWNLSSEDYEAWAGKRGTAAYLALLEAAGLLWLRDGERIVSWWIDLGDGGWLESPPPVVRRVRYTPRGGWGNPPMVHILDHRSAPGQPGKRVRDLEQVEGNPWPAHWPTPRLPLTRAALAVVPPRHGVDAHDVRP